MEWASAKLRDVAEEIEHDSLDPGWANAMRLAHDLVDSVAAQIAAPEPSA